MFNILTDLADQQPNKQPRFKASDYLEPHVAYYDIYSKEKELFILPFKVIGWCLLAFTIAGFASFMIWGNQLIAQIFFCLLAILGPFYLPGIYYYFKCLKKEQDTRIEVDAKHGLIKYEKPGSDKNILFHESQIENCTIRLSLLFPYKINYLNLRLKGGYNVTVSSLILEPQDLVQLFNIPYTIETYWINKIPVKMA
ncbi:MAG: hypothetical protein AAFR87_03750 [Bacteroidota bacterium]